MDKRLQIISIITLLMVLVVSCAPQPSPALPASEAEEVVQAPPKVPATGEAPVDDVATDISDASATDDELDTSELDGVDSILVDIENI